MSDHMDEPEEDFHPAKPGDNPIWLGGMKYVPSDLYEAERAENESQKQEQIEDVRRKVKITLAAIWVWLIASLLMIFLTIATC